MKRLKTLFCVLALLALGGCASVFSHSGSRQAGSVVDYLYPDRERATSDPGIQVERSGSGRGAGGIGWPAALALAGVAICMRRRHA